MAESVANIVAYASHLPLWICWGRVAGCLYIVDRDDQDYISMTQRLYYDDSYTTEFSANIVEQLTVDERPAVVLDRTCFYPASGGQPFDTGKINDTAVVDVFTRDSDAAVVHVLAEPITGEAVQGCLDWERRVDHMQHHTGQHILTQAFVQLADANTVGFHLGEESITIDLDVTNLTSEMVADVEDLANQIVRENRAITVRLIDPDDVENVRMRKMPDHLLTDGLRVVDIENFDVTACGGTHVARTGEIGLIKVLKLEKRGDKTRVEFRCGARALHDYREKNNIVNHLAAELTCGHEEIPSAVSRLQDDLRQAHRELRGANKQLADYEVEQLLAKAIEHNGVRIVKATFDERSVKELRTLTNNLIQASGVIVLLGSAGDKAQIILARSHDLPYNMNTMLQRVLPILDARGGGRPDFAQGGGVKADTVQVQATLSEAMRIILTDQ
jgi:alanyl-tRNA synthetase